MKIVETNNLKIYPTKQTINHPLGLPPPFDDRNQIIVLTGAMGSGKSTWLHSALTCKKKDGRIFAGCYERVLYATPEECFSSEENHPMKKHVKSRLFHEFNEKMLSNVAEQALNCKHLYDGNTLLCIDDFSEELKNVETIKLLKKLIFKHRHLHLTIVISCLTMKSIPKSIRSLVDVYCIFKPKGLNELEDYLTEVFALKNLQMQRLMDFVFDKPHNFLMYNTRHNHYYKNFDKLAAFT